METTKKSTKKTETIKMKVLKSETGTLIRSLKNLVKPQFRDIAVLQIADLIQQINERGDLTLPWTD